MQEENKEVLMNSPECQAAEEELATALKLLKA